MSTTDQYIVEAIKSQIADEITDKVHARIIEDVRTLKLFGRYAAIVAAIVGVLAVYFHKDIFGIVVKYGSSQLEERVRAQVADQLKALDAAHTKSTAVLEVTSEQRTQFLKSMLEHRDAAEALKFDYDKRKAELTNLIQANSEASDTTRERIADAQTKALAQIDLQYADLVAKMEALKKAVIADAQRNPGSTSPSAATQVTTTPVTTERKPTLYFQFAGFRRSDAEAISKQLQTRGIWSIPGEERTSAAIGFNEIRHHPDDIKAAQRLEADANQILQPYKIQVVARQNRQAKAGFLELWISQP